MNPAKSWLKLLKKPDFALQQAGIIFLSEGRCMYISVSERRSTFCSWGIAVVYVKWK